MLDRLIRTLGHALSRPLLLLSLLLSLQLWSLSPLLSQLLISLCACDMLRHLCTLERRLQRPDQWSVVIAGAGFSGLCAAAKLREVGIENVVILEQADKLGGTWEQNVYPGVGCDVRSHQYSVSYFPNPWWSRAYSGGQEIWNYLDAFATKFDLHKFIKYSYSVSKANWIEDKASWMIKTENGKTFEANFFIRATGPLRIPLVPEFKDRSLYEKPVIHTAQWDSSLDLSDKRVAVIGTGASAVQAVPKLAEKVRELHVFQRTPAYTPERNNFKYPHWLRKIFYYVPWTQVLYRYFNFWQNEVIFHLLFSNANSSTAKMVTKLIVKSMKKSLGGDKALCDQLIPKYPAGCKRITPAVDYLTAFRQPHVHLNSTGIDRFCQSGIVTKTGQTVNVDAIILATGFDVMKTFTPFPVHGRDNLDLEKEFGDCPSLNVGTTYPGLPNMFFMLGPNTGLGHSSIIYVIECQVTYLIDCIRQLERAGKSSMDCKRSAKDRYTAWIKREMKDRAFNSSQCTAWYKNSAGVNYTLWPKDLISFWWELLWCKTEDYTFK